MAVKQPDDRTTGRAVSPELNLESENPPVQMMLTYLFLWERSAVR